MQSTKLVVFALMLCIAGCAATRELQGSGSRPPVCSPGTQPGQVCRPTSDADPCIQPINPSNPLQCSNDLFTLLSYLVNVNTAAPGPCGDIPCCDVSPGQPVLCADAQLGCLAQAKLCVAGGAGALLANLLGPNIDILIP
jgi:hypothetical protein